MKSGIGSFRMIVMIGVPVLFLISVIMLDLLLNEVLTILMAWILASFPIGVLIGHCVLNED